MGFINPLTKSAQAKATSLPWAVIVRPHICRPTDQQVNEKNYFWKCDFSWFAGAKSWEN